MAESKKRKLSRKSPKIYQFVSFMSDLFDGEFQFPKIAHMPLRVIAALDQGDMGAVTQWLKEAGADAESVEAFLDLSQDEAEGFMAAWGAGQPVDLPKS